MEEQLKKLYPCLRGIMYDEYMFLVTYFLIPKDWNYELIPETFISETQEVDKFILLTLKKTVNHLEEVTLASVLNLLEEVVNFNLGEVKKNALIEAQMNALKNLTYEQIVSLSAERLNGFKEVEFAPDHKYGYVTDLENSKISPMSGIRTQIKPVKEFSAIDEQSLIDSDEGVRYTPLAQVSGYYSEFDAPSDYNNDQAHEQAVESHEDDMDDEEARRYDALVRKMQTK